MPTKIASTAPRRIDTRQVLATSWRKTREHFGLWVSVIVLLVLASSVSAVGQKMGVLGPLFWLAGLFLPALFGLGMMRIGIDAADGKPLSLAPIGQGWPDLVGFMIAGTLYGFMVGLGTLLFIVPGIVWTAQYMFATHVVADRHMSPFKAMGASAELTRGVRYELLVFTFALTLLNLAGLLALGVGLLLTIPMSAIAMGIVYRQLCEAAGPSTGPSQSSRGGYPVRTFRS